jgi:5,6-dimethylbenzimidazole synthase
LCNPTYDVINRRRDTRREFTGAPVDPQALRRVLSAAHCAPSVGMSQPWDFVIVRSPATLERFAAHVAQERATFAGTLSGERAETFSRIKVEGVTESGLGIVVSTTPVAAGRESSAVTRSRTPGSTRSSARSRTSGWPPQPRGWAWGG